MIKNSPTALIVCSFAAPVEKGHFHFTSAQLTPFKTLQVRKHFDTTDERSEESGFSSSSSSSWYEHKHSTLCCGGDFLGDYEGGFETRGRRSPCCNLVFALQVAEPAGLLGKSSFSFI